jgi:alkylhydroperoxidase family enzyme
MSRLPYPARMPSPTLEAALRPHAIDRDEVVRRYPGPAALVERILGVVPSAVGYFEIWPPALVTYNLTVPTLFDVPKCDLGLGISPDLRAVVAHAASRGFGCRYCMAHTAVMGTVVRGPLTAPQISSRVLGIRDVESLGTHARAAADYAYAIAAIPSKVTPEHRAALGRAFRPAHVEAVVMVASAMGYLNRYMDTLGTVLETAILDSVSGSLGDAGWDPGQHFDESMGEGEARGLARRSRLSLVREIPQAVAYEREALREVPAAGPAIAERLRETIGFVPYYFETISRDAVRRLFAHYWLERLTTPGVDVSVATKYVMGWIVAKAADNATLAGHFAFAAHRAGVSVADLQAALAAPTDPAASAEAAAFALAHAASRTAADVPTPVIEALMATHQPASIIELLLVLSVGAALQRYTASLPPGRPEPEIAAFVAAHPAR